MPLKVIGAGLGRTGTNSLKLALEQLGFGPCYHMIEVFKNGKSHMDFWIEAGAADPTTLSELNWERVFAEYGSTTDFPAASYFEEIMKAYPDAKVVLTIRDAEKWYESASESIYAIGSDWSTRVLAIYIPFFTRLLKISHHIWEEYPFKGQFHDRKKTLAAYVAFNERVKNVVPPNKLLVFDVKEGWGPLCTFLNVPIPSTPFPHVNERDEFRKRILRGRVLASAILAGTAGALCALVWLAASQVH